MAIMFSNIFECYGENSQSGLDEFNSFFDDTTQKLFDSNFEVYVNGQIYHTDFLLEEADVIIRLIRRNWCYIQNIILNNSTVPHNELISVRKEINKSLKLIIDALKYCKSDTFKARYLSSVIKYMNTFLPLVLPLAKMEETVYLKLSSSAPNKEICPVYQYFHTLLDIKYYSFMLDYVSGNSDNFKRHITETVTDFITLSLKCFNQNKKSAFVCDCHKTLWLIIQLLCEKVLDEDSFWRVFNKAVENHDEKFVIWLLRDIGNLQAVATNGKYIGCLSERIKPNYILLETSLRAILLNSSGSILSSLKAIEPLLCSLWIKSSRIEVFQMLWDYFCKRLNMLPKRTTHISMIELVELIDTILWTPKDCNQEFELFLSMLSTHLNEHPYHWGKMKGRIYSQLGPNKIKELNSTGLFYVLLMFVSLSKFSFDELSKKFLMLIDNLPTEKKRSEIIWSFYTAFMVRYIRENKSIEAISAPFNKMLEQASSDHNMFHLVKQFVTDFDNIVKYSANLQLKQYHLINIWMHKYMTTCYYSDLVSLLNVLINIIDRVNNEQVWCDWETSYRDYVYPTLKHIASSRSAPELSGTLAAKIALSCPNLLPEAFTFFNNESIIPKVSSNFLCVILENYPHSFIMSPQQETIALQSWIKTCLLTRDNYEAITRNIVKLDIIPAFIKTEISQARDPLCAFIECIAVNIHQHLQSPTMLKFCENCFGQAERWITQYLNQPDNEVTVLRIYTCIGLAFYKIGPLLYSRHKANCFFTRIVSSVLLTTELVIGRPINPYVLQAVKKTWQLFFEATVKLNTPSDPYLERTLRELVVRYIPHFANVDSPMLRCLDNEALAEVILDKMSVAFFKQPTKEAESNVFKALRIINEFVQSTTSETLVRLVVNKTLSGLFEVAMFHSQRNLALSVIKNITSSPLFPQVRVEFEEIVMVVTEKHLAFNTPNYFQLMGALVKFIPNNVKILMPRIKQHISHVERLRGVGFDKNLRLSIERLEANLTQM